MNAPTILDEVLAERVRQHRTHGVQHLPDATGGGYFASMAGIYQRFNDAATQQGWGVRWAELLLEEVYEVLAETQHAALRAELIQVAALAVQWVEAIDARDDAVPTDPRQCMCGHPHADHQQHPDNAHECDLCDCPAWIGWAP